MVLQPEPFCCLHLAFLGKPRTRRGRRSFRPRQAKRFSKPQTPTHKKTKRKPTRRSAAVQLGSLWMNLDQSASLFGFCQLSRSVAKQHSLNLGIWSAFLWQSLLWPSSNPSKNDTSMGCVHPISSIILALCNQDGLKI